MANASTNSRLSMMTRRSRSLLIADYDSPVPETPGISSYEPTRFETGGHVIMLKSSNAASSPQIIHTSVVQCNAAETSEQRAAFYLSVIAGVFPALYPVAEEVMREIGYSVVEVNENEVGAHHIDLKPWVDPPTVLTVFGQLSLIIYNNINPTSYSNFIQITIPAIKIQAGMRGDLVPGGGDALLSYEVAKSIRIVVGGSPRMRAALLKTVLANREGHNRLNRVCNYIADCLRWTDMEPLVSVHKTLCVTKSPVLADLRVRAEAIRLCEAFRRVAEKEYRPYFCILYPTEAIVTWKSRFSTLAQVSRLYRLQQNSTTPQFANPLVQSLLAIHNDHMMRTAVASQIPRVVGNFFTDIDIEEAEIDLGYDCGEAQVV